jgi:hypothetical protein
LSYAAGLALLALMLPVALLGKSDTLDGVRYWWLADDAMISMRYGRNLAEGLGLVWNAGERVEGYTNLLWTLFMALVHLTPLPDSKTSLVVLLANVGIAAATVPLIGWLVRLLGGGAWATGAALAAYVLGADTSFFATSGMETSLLAFLLVLCVCRVLEESRSGTPRASTYLAIGALGLVRADAVILSGLVCGASLVLNKDRKTVAYYCLLALAPVIASETFRILYYGEPLPNTAYLKATNWDDRYAAGWKYVSGFARTYALPCIFAAVGVGLAGSRVRLVLGSVLLLYAAYVVYVGGDMFPSSRFFVPVIPVLFSLAFVTVQDLPTPAVHRLAIGALCLLSVPTIVWTYPSLLSPSAPESGDVQIGLYLKENTPPDAVVADTAAGSVFYFSRRTGVDLLGKTDPYIARQAPAAGGMVPGHNKFDYSYSLDERQPDYVVSGFLLPVSEEDMLALSTGDAAYVGQLYFHPSFQEHCLPNPLITDTWRTIFRCVWSPAQGSRLANPPSGVTHPAYRSQIASPRTFSTPL